MLNFFHLLSQVMPDDDRLKATEDKKATMAAKLAGLATAVPLKGDSGAFAPFLGLSDQLCAAPLEPVSLTLLLTDEFSLPSFEASHQMLLSAFLSIDYSTLQFGSLLTPFFSGMAL